MQQVSLLLFFCLTFFTVNAQWEGYEAGFDDVLTIWDMDAVDDQTVWALGMGGVYSGNGWNISPSHSFSTTKDSGETWTVGELPVPNNNWAGIQVSAIDENVAYVGASSFWGGGAVYKTVDGGMSWEQLPVFDEFLSFVSVVHFWDVNRGIAIGDPVDNYFEIQRTFDAGATWERVPSEQIAPPLSGEFVATSTYDSKENHIWFGTNLGRIFRSTDGGQTWSASETPIGNQPTYTVVEGIAFQDSLIGIVHSAEYTSVPFVHTIAYTEDGGLTWTQQDVENPFFSIFKSQYIPETSTLVATSRESNGVGVFRTSYSLDHGVSWMDIDTETPIMDFEFFDAETAWAGKFKNDNTPTQLYKFTGNPITSVFNPKPLDITLNVFPNPTSDYIHASITFDTPTHLTLQILDVTGQIIFEDELGYDSYFSEHINLSNFSAGIYSLLLKTEAGTSVRKVAKL